MSKHAYSVAKIELPATPMVSQGSWGARSVGTHASTMELWRYPDQPGYAFIEWDIPGLDEVEHIGITWEEPADGRRVVTDYDGVMDIPREAVDFLRAQGFDVSEIEA